VNRLPEGSIPISAKTVSSVARRTPANHACANLLKRPLLVLLDEATTNLDLDNEAAVLRDLWANIDRNAIILMVTHRAPVGIDFTMTFDLDGGTITARNPADTVEI
jgi:ABC-type transport system involved in cytochrome bd biosynthesis fused ATPase/permease subunit